MTLFEFVNLLVDLLFGALHRLTDFTPCLVRLLCSRVLVRLLNLSSSIFSIAQRFLYRPFRLLDDAFIRQFLIADRLAYSLLDLSNRLIRLASDLFLIHNSLSLSEMTLAQFHATSKAKRGNPPSGLPPTLTVSVSNNTIAQYGNLVKIAHLALRTVRLTEWRKMPAVDDPISVECPVCGAR